VAWGICLFTLLARTPALVESYFFASWFADVMDDEGEEEEHIEDMIAQVLDEIGLDFSNKVPPWPPPNEARWGQAEAGMGSIPTLFHWIRDCLDQTEALKAML
jgi:hypothetical protein